MLSNLIWALGALKYRLDDDFFAVFNDVVAETHRRVHRSGRVQRRVHVRKLGRAPGRAVARDVGRRVPAAHGRVPSAGRRQHVLGLGGGSRRGRARARGCVQAKIGGRDPRRTVFSHRSRADISSHARVRRVEFPRRDDLGQTAVQRPEVWEQASQGRVTISKLHRDVSETLTRMGVPHEIERLAADGCFSVDIALRGRKVAIEVDGPSHFLANIMDQRIGADRLRTEYLREKGWKVREPGATSQSRGGKRGGGRAPPPPRLSPFQSRGGFSFRSRVSSLPLVGVSSLPLVGVSSLPLVGVSSLPLAVAMTTDAF